MPQSPKWFETPKSVFVLTDPKEVKRSPLGDEISVSVVGDGKRWTAIVPSEAVDETGKVKAVEVGEIGNLVLVSFPASSGGTATWPMPRAILGRFVVARDSP